MIVIYSSTFVVKTVTKHYIHHLILKEAKYNKLPPTARISEGEVFLTELGKRIF